MASKEISRKITIGTIAGKATKWFTKVMELKGEKLHLCKLYGVATGYVPGASEFGEYLKFRGQFRGVNMETGETQDAPLVILPTHVAEMLRSQLEAGALSVQFSFNIFVRFDVTSAVKYTYSVESALAPSGNDPLAAIEAAMEAQLAIENTSAPAAAPAAAPKAAPAPAPTSSKRR